METMRYKGEAPSKTLWLAGDPQNRPWGRVDGNLVPITGGATWFDEGAPWAEFDYRRNRLQRRCTGLRESKRAIEYSLS